MKLYRTKKGILVDDQGDFRLLPGGDWDELLNRPGLPARLRRAAKKAKAVRFDPDRDPILAPIVSQEVWAAGVTYFRSRDARVEESKAAGGGDFYSRVYEAPRPEIFFKANPHRVVGHRAPVRIRRDSTWNVPEPELALVVNSAGKIAGYTVCNDMSSRDIEGENPLYLPQAKTYDGCCALGPGILVAEGPLPKETRIRLEILRGGSRAFEGETGLDRLKRTFDELVGWLTREASFPAGCVFSTGTGIVPPNEFSLRSGDEVRISIDGLGTLSNPVA
jgi:2-dehydro-3-deoxy-D-arabinonate dehydratase